MRILIGLLAFATAWTGSAAHDVGQAKYLGNEGVLVTRGETKILFDAFYAESFNGLYHLVPSTIETAMMAGEKPFDGIDAMFVSHIHPDHFNSRKIIAYLRANPTVRLYAGLDVIGAIYAADVPVGDPIMKRVVQVNAARGAPPVRFDFGELEIEAYSIPHNGRGPIPHYAFRVTLDRATTVMHLGDADPSDDSYSPYQGEFDKKRTQVAFAPVWMVTDAAGKRVLEQRIRPVKTIGIHAQVKTGPSKPGAVAADVFTRPGETRPLGQ